MITISYGPPSAIPLAAPQNNKAQVVGPSKRGCSLLSVSGFRDPQRVVGKGILRAVKKRRKERVMYRPILTPSIIIMVCTLSAENAPA